MYKNSFSEQKTSSGGYYFHNVSHVDGVRIGVNLQANRIRSHTVWPPFRPSLSFLNSSSLGMGNRSSIYYVPPNLLDVKHLPEASSAQQNFHLDSEQ